jgi:hypothetical protein
MKGIFAFVPAGCSVAGPGSGNVSLTTATDTELKFTASAVGLYTLTVQYACAVGSTAQLKENCGSPLILRNLDSNVSPSTTYTFSIS